MFCIYGCLLFFATFEPESNIMFSIHIFLGMIGAPQVILIIVVVLLLFGGRKIPELMRGLGSGIKEFKAATKEEEEEDSKKKKD